MENHGIKKVTEGGIHDYPEQEDRDICRCEGNATAKLSEENLPVAAELSALIE
jgi:hypothetical protein